MNVTTLKELVYYADERFGEETFVIEYKKRQFVEHSYRQFRQDCDALGAWFNEQFSDRVHAAVIGLTSYEYLVAWFGIQCSGNVSVPLDNANNAERIADEIVRSDSEVVFVDDNHLKDVDTFRQLCPKVKHYFHLHHTAEGVLFLGDLLAQYQGQQPTKSSQPADMAAILFTSGTTGKSKGVMLSNENLIDNATCEPDLGFHGNKRMTVLPIHHIFCFTCDMGDDVGNHYEG